MKYNGYIYRALFWWLATEQRPTSMLGICDIVAAAVISLLAAVAIPLWKFVLVPTFKGIDWCIEHRLEILLFGIMMPIAVTVLIGAVAFIGWAFVVLPIYLWWTGAMDFWHAFGLDLMLGAIAAFLFAVIGVINGIGWVRKHYGEDIRAKFLSPLGAKISAGACTIHNTLCVLKVEVR